MFKTMVPQRHFLLVPTCSCMKATKGFVKGDCEECWLLWELYECWVLRVDCNWWSWECVCVCVWLNHVQCCMSVVMGYIMYGGGYSNGGLWLKMAGSAMTWGRERGFVHLHWSECRDASLPSLIYPYWLTADPPPPPTHTHTHTGFYVLWGLYRHNGFLYCTDCIFYPLTPNLTLTWNFLHF